MRISKSIKWIRRFFIPVFLCSIAILGYVGFRSSVNGHLLIGLPIVSIVTIRLIFLKWDEIVYTDDGIQYMKRDKKIRMIRWDDYDTVSIDRGYQGNIVVTLLNYTNQNKYSLFFSWWFLASEDGKKIVDFIEKRYGVSIK